MFITVQLLNGFHEPLLYSVPHTWPSQPSIGSVVQVPLRAKIVPALVTHIAQEKPANLSFTIKDAHTLEEFPSDQHYLHFMTQLARYYTVEPVHLIKRLKQFLKQTTRDASFPYNTSRNTVMLQLTDEQQQVATFLMHHITNPAYTPTLLHGVTASGKTEVYKKLMMHAIQEHKSVLFLLPEVTLAIAFAHRLRTELPTDTPLYSFHSATTPQEKRTLWQHLINQHPVIIIGVHLPVLLPIHNLGLIIVDEEHETGYQEKKHPKINSKDAAIWRASLYNIPILLGSATPSLQTLHNVEQKKWHFFQLKNRFAGLFPAVKVVLLTDKAERKNFWISTPLYNAIKERLAHREQTIIFLNRRGFSFFVQCSQCSFVFRCPNCSVSLTLHADNQLTCHYCAYSITLSPHCTQCNADGSSLLKKGIGTQQIVAILQKLFPNARIARADLDTTSKQKNWDTTVQKMHAGEIDILVGTQTITKGYDFAGVTLVGIVWADLNLHFPLFNASETTLQQLLQVAGRAGRKTSHSLVIVQAMENHDIFAYLNEIDYLQFFTDALSSRQALGYPPCKRLVEIEMKHRTAQILEKEAQRLAHYLITQKNQSAYDIQILGPAKPPVHTIANTHIRKIYIKGADIGIILHLFNSIKQSSYKSSLYYTPNPLT
jgi:primosomal protein N' (replication factor Y) (superfamily II helicase)